MQLIVQLVDIIFWNGENHGDGLNLGDNGQERAAAGHGEISRIDQAQTDSAGNGRRDDGESIAPCRNQGPLIRFDQPLSCRTIFS